MDGRIIGLHLFGGGFNISRIHSGQVQSGMPLRQGEIGIGADEGYAEAIWYIYYIDYS